MTTTEVSRRARRRVGAVSIVLALGLGLTGCSGSSDSSDSPSSAAAPPSSHRPTVAQIVKPAAGPTRAQHPVPSGSEIREVPALRKSVALTSCRATAKGWAGSGVAKNPTARAKTYHLLVFFNDRFSRTIDSATAKVQVPAGAARRWTAKRIFTAPRGTQCVLRGLY